MSRYPFISEPAPDHPGWTTWGLSDDTRYNTAILGRLLIRPGDSATKAWVRMFPEHRHSNFAENIHGGTILGFIDVALFGASHQMNLLPGPSLTLDLSTQFIGPGKINVPLDAEVELLKETGRLLFLRGLVMQDGHSVASFSGTIRKGNPPAS